MGDNTAIEWTDATWNPLVGCTVVSPGCTNCYAMQLSGTRLAHIPRYAGLTQPSKVGPVWNGTVRLVEEVLTQPLRWTRPRRVFVNSMSDIFHESVPDEWIDRIFAVMALAPQHTFQVLTKRAERMRRYLSMDRAQPVGLEALGQTMKSMSENRRSKVGSGIILTGDDGHLKMWPLPNVWLGVSAEDQKRADERVPLLLDTPAAMRFVSGEPVLGQIRFDRLNVGQSGVLNALTGRWSSYPIFQTTAGPMIGAGLPNLPALDWIIVGGESGPKARPMHPEWARSIREQCAAAGVPFLFKQWGEYASAKGFPGTMKIDHLFDDGYQMMRVGKKQAGRLLDGREHNGYPEVRR